MSALTPELDEARRSTAWPLERVLFLMAGIVVLASIALAVLLSPWFLLLTALQHGSLHRLAPDRPRVNTLIAPTTSALFL